MHRDIYFYFREHAEKAIDIITAILPGDHLLIASSKRVKGQYIVSNNNYNTFLFIL